MNTYFLQAFARLPEPDRDTDTGLLLIFMGAVVVAGIAGVVRARLAYKRGYRDGLADGRAGEESAPVAPEIKIKPQPRRIRPRDW